MKNDEKSRDQMLDTDYDGIREYNNELPRWWVILFFMTIVFAVVYVMYRSFLKDITAPEILAGKMSETESQQLQAAKAEPQVALSPEALAALVKDKEALKKGGEIFLSRCAPCHGRLGEGIIGPNLTDDYWIHGGKILEIHHTIEAGVPEKGMLTWKGVLGGAEISNAAAYVKSLRGSNPPKAKEPQGTLLVWPY